MSWATPEDVIDRWVGPGAPADEELIQRWLDDAAVIIRSEVPDIDERLADPETPPDEATVVFVQARMVMRCLQNPRGVRQEGVGPYNTTYAGTAPGTPWLTTEELALLLGEPARGRQKAFTVDTTPAEAMTPPPDPWG
jgi:hypothetical protein